MWMSIVWFTLFNAMQKELLSYKNISLIVTVVISTVQYNSNQINFLRYLYF